MNVMNAIPQSLRYFLVTLLAGWVAVVSAAGADAQPTNAVTHKIPGWLRSAVLYEIFPRDFSPTGDFNGITAVQVLDEPGIPEIPGQSEH